MSKNFTPDLKPYTGQGKFKYWVQMVLPLIYDDSLSYMELLNKVVVYLNNVIEDNKTMIKNIDELKNYCDELKEYIDNFIDELDLQGAIDHYMDENLERLLSKFLNNIVSPEFYGAIGDGVTDDTNAFREMLSDLSVLNKLAIIPSKTYLLNELLVSDESYILQNNGVYNNQKLIVSKTLDAVFTEEVIKSFRFNESIVQEIGGTMQGCCYDETRDVVWIAWANNDTDPAYLVSYSQDFNQELQVRRIEISSHFNDLTYNPITDKLITPARPETNLLYVINPNDMSYETVTVNVGDIIKRCSYDKDNNVYYIATDDNVYVLNENFEICHNISITETYLVDALNITGSVLRQGSTIVNSIYLELITAINSDGEFNDYWIISYNLQHGNIKKIWHKTETETLVNEAEGLYTIGNNVYISFSAGRKITFSNLTGYDFVNIGTVPVLKNLKTGDNMNDYIEKGAYICGSNTLAASLVNCPVNRPFRMYVIPNINGRYCIQVYITNLGDITYRNYRYDTNTWENKGYIKNWLVRNTSSGANWEIDTAGYYKFYGSRSVNITSWTEVGSLYYSNEVTIEIPGDIHDIINYTFQASTNNHCMVNNVTVSGNLIKFRVISPNQTPTSSTIRFNFEGRMTP